MEGYTKKEIDGARAAKILHRHFQCPGYEAFKSLLKTNVIQDCPVTMQDAINAEKHCRVLNAAQSHRPCLHWFHQQTCQEEVPATHVRHYKVP